MTLSLPASSHLLVRLAAVAALGAALRLGGGVGPLDFDDDYPKPTDYPIHGIDVSKYQGTIDWNAVATAASNSSGSRRPRAATISTSASRPIGRRQQAGIPHGAYHFVYWCRPPIEEATWFEQNVPVEEDALPPVLDVEPTPESKTCNRHLEREAAIADMKVMLEEMERHFGKRPIIYTSVDFYEAILSDGAFADYPIWVRSTKHHPAVRYGSRQWKFWQYQADGAIPGIRPRRPQRVHGTPEQW